MNIHTAIHAILTRTPQHFNFSYKRFKSNDPTYFLINTNNNITSISLTIILYQYYSFFFNILLLYACNIYLFILLNP